MRVSGCFGCLLTAATFLFAAMIRGMTLPISVILSAGHAD